MSKYFSPLDTSMSEFSKGSGPESTRENTKQLFFSKKPLNSKYNRKIKLNEKKALRISCELPKISVPNSGDNYQKEAMKLVDSLNDWEKTHVTTTKKKQTGAWSRSFVKKSTRLIRKHSFGTFNFKNKLSSDSKTLKNLKSVKQLNKFFDEIEQTNSALVANSIKINRVRFDFNAFYHKEDEKDQKFDGEEFSKVGGDLYIKKKVVETCRDSSIKANRLEDCDNGDEIVVQEKTLKNNDLSIKGKYKNLMSKEHYLEIINERQRMEKINRDEIIELLNLMKEQKRIISETSEKLERVSKTYQEEKQLYEDTLEFSQKIEKTQNEKLHSLKGGKNSAYMKLVVSLGQKIYQQRDILKKAQERFLSAENDYKLEGPGYEQVLNEAKQFLHTVTELYKKTIEESKSYYFHILREGIDVRDTGLTWIIFKLKELGAEITIQHFPKFVDNASFKYLMDYTEKKFILAKLEVLSNLILSSFVKKSSKRGSRRTSIFLGATTIKSLSKEQLLELLNGIDKSLKDETVVLTNEADLADKENIRKALNQIKGLCETNETIEFFGNARERFDRIISHDQLKKEEIIEAISIIRNLISRYEKEMIEMKKNHIFYIKNKYISMKTQGISECVKYDLMYSALFGNHIVI